MFSLKILKRIGIVTFHWFFEDYRRASYWRDIISGYDYFAAIQHGPITDACVKMGTSYMFLPPAASWASLSEIQRPKTHDVGFVGIPTAYRVEVLEYLAQNGISLSIAGQGWEQYDGVLGDSITKRGWISPEETSKLLSSTKTGINLSVSAPFKEDAEAHVGPRAFEVIACGAELVTENVPLARETISGCSYRVFDSKEQALEKIKEALEKWNIEKNRREENRLEILKHHTYSARAKTLNDIARGIAK
jgi:hypothetical protein